MIPIIGFICWNRMGMTIQNINLLLKTNNDFELYIIDNNSKDNTWEFLQTLNDSRIKEIKRFDKNYGVVYALNYVISKRKLGQPFINIENDVSILNTDWISNCEKVIKEFPEIGVLGNVRPTYFKERNTTYNEFIRNKIKFWKTNGIIGCCMYFTSEIMNIMGYFNEELCLPDIEIGKRMDILGKWIGYCPDNKILYQQIKCSKCNHAGLCKSADITDKNLDCFKSYNLEYKHLKFFNKNIKAMKEYMKNINRNSLYCPSIHDKKSLEKYQYNIKKAMSNFDFFSKDD